MEKISSRRIEKICQNCFEHKSKRSSVQLRVKHLFIINQIYQNQSIKLRYKFSLRYGNSLKLSQFARNLNDHKYLDYSFIEYYRKALKLSGPICEKSYCDNFKCRMQVLYRSNLDYHSIYRDFFVGSLIEIKHLIQCDFKPSILTKARLDIYKISITFPQFSKR